MNPVLLTLTGVDRPALTTSLLAQLPSGVTVLDIEQVVVHGRLTLAVLLDDVARLDSLQAVMAQFARDEDVELSLTEPVDTGATKASGRANVVVLGARLASEALAAVTSDIAFSGANIDQIRRLANEPVTAIEFDVSGADVPALRRQLALDATAYQVDIAVAQGGLARRGHRLLVMDVDSTLIRDEVIELLAAQAGSRDEVAAITERAMRGELDFGQSLRERVATLEGLPVGAFDEVRESVRLTPGARTLVRTVQHLGFQVGLVSGGFAEVVEPLASDLGITMTRANRLQVRDGRLTGRLDGAIVDRAAKADALREFADQAKVPLARTVAIGDGANDLDMIAAAGLGIAFNAKPIVRTQADTSISVPYLDSVLYLLGISRADILEATSDTSSLRSVEAPTL